MPGAHRPDARRLGVQVASLCAVPAVAALALGHVEAWSVLVAVAAAAWGLSLRGALTPRSVAWALAVAGVLVVLSCLQPSVRGTARWLTVASFRLHVAWLVSFLTIVVAMVQRPAWVASAGCLAGVALLVAQRAFSLAAVTTASVGAASLLRGRPFRRVDAVVLVVAAAIAPLALSSNRRVRVVDHLGAASREAGTQSDLVRRSVADVRAFGGSVDRPLPCARDDFALLDLARRWGGGPAALVLAAQLSLSVLLLRAAARSRTGAEAAARTLVGLRIGLGASGHALVSAGLLPPCGIDSPFLGAGGASWALSSGLLALAVAPAPHLAPATTYGLRALPTPGETGAGLRSPFGARPRRVVALALVTLTAIGGSLARTRASSAPDPSLPRVRVAPDARGAAARALLSSVVVVAGLRGDDVRSAEVARELSRRLRDGDWDPPVEVVVVVAVDVDARRSDLRPGRSGAGTDVGFPTLDGPAPSTRAGPCQASEPILRAVVAALDDDRVRAALVLRDGVAASELRFHGPVGARRLAVELGGELVLDVDDRSVPGPASAEAFAAEVLGIPTISLTLGPDEATRSVASRVAVAIDRSSPTQELADGAR